MPRVLTFLFAVMLFASNVYSMTMDEAVSHALKNNSELQALRLEEGVVKKESILCGAGQVLLIEKWE